MTAATSATAPTRRPGLPGLWWTALGRAGLTEERWRGLRPWQRRAVKAAVVLVLGMLVLAPIYGFDGGAYLAALVVVVLYVPDWDRVRFGRFVLPAAVLLLCILYPYFVDHLPALPIFTSFPSIDTAFLMAVYVMMALGLNIVVGYAGLLDLGYVAFYALGAYTAAWLASPHGDRWGASFTLGGTGVPVGIGGIHISIWIVLLAAAIVAAFAGVVIGLPTLRLRGDYLAIVTLGFGEIVYVLAKNGDCMFKGFAGKCINVTNGSQGINPIDPPGFGHWLHRTIHVGGWHPLPSDFLSSPNSSRDYYWAAIVLVLFVVYCTLRLRDSKLGRAWIAIREDETAAAAMGVPLMRTKTWAYAIGAFFGGIAGAFLKSQQGGAFYQDFLFNFSIFVLCMVILGGMGSIWGVILGGAFLAYLNIEGIGNIGGWINDTFGTNSDLTKYSSGIYGLILVLMMLFRPAGLIPSARAKAEFEEGVADEPLYDVEHSTTVTQ
jgi:branched-chain amino acid transport system permease protein